MSGPSSERAARWRRRSPPATTTSAERPAIPSSLIALAAPTGATVRAGPVDAIDPPLVAAFGGGDGG